MATISDNLQAVRARIARAAERAHRDPASVTLLAVSKTHAAGRIESAYAAGQRAFGENYVQEAIGKMLALQSRCASIEWHLIGPLQSNKTRAVAQYFDWVQSVDREKIAARLSQQRPAHRAPLNVLVQVNISGEGTKGGARPEEVEALAGALVRLPRLRLRGLMAIPQPGAFAQFDDMKRLYERLREKFRLDTLSMGMSDDLEPAIAAGATMVRIGTAIFGARVKEGTVA